MKATRLFYGEKRLKDVYVGASKWQVAKFKFIRSVKRTVIVLAVFSLIGDSMYAGQKLFAPVNVDAAPQVVERIVVATTTAPVLQRIAKCESGNSQYDKNGQVLMRVNNNKSVDVGKFQINSVHFVTATKLGYDLTKERDNEAFAKWMYENKGTQDWYASKECWSK